MKQMFVIIFFGILIAVGLYFYSTTIVANIDSNIDVAEEELSTLQTKISQLDVKTTSANNTIKEVEHNLTGYEDGRVVADKKIIDEFLNQVFTWDSYEAYTLRRNSLMKRFNLMNVDDNTDLYTNENMFFRVFMAKPAAQENANGDIVWNEIDDDGLNMHFEQSTLYVDNIGKDGTYSYVVDVIYSAQDSNASEARAHAILTCAVSAKKDIISVDGYTISK